MHRRTNNPMMQGTALGRITARVAAVLLATTLAAAPMVRPGPAAADDPGDEVLAPVAGEACLYVFVALLITSSYAPSETLRAFEPALVACNQVPPAGERRYCQPDHYLFDEMNARSPNDIDTGPFGLLTDEAAAVERSAGVPAQGRLSPHLDEHMDCVDRRKQSNDAGFDGGGSQGTADDERPAGSAHHDEGAGLFDLPVAPVLSAAAGLGHGDPVLEAVASPTTRFTPAATATGRVGPAPGSLGATEILTAGLAGLAGAIAAVRLTLRRTQAPARSRS